MCIYVYYIYIHTHREENSNCQREFEMGERTGKDWIIKQIWKNVNIWGALAKKYIYVGILCTIFILFCKPEIMSKYKAKRKKTLHNTENQTLHKSKSQTWAIIQPPKLIKKHFWSKFWRGWYFHILLSDNWFKRFEKK